MSNFNKTLEQFAEKLEKFHVKSPESLERQKQKNKNVMEKAQAAEAEYQAYRTARGPTAIEKALEERGAATANPPKTVKKATAKSSFYRRNNKGKTLRKAPKSSRQVKFEERRKQTAAKAAEKRKTAKEAKTAKLRTAAPQGTVRTRGQTQAITKKKVVRAKSRTYYLADKKSVKARTAKISGLTNAQRSAVKRTLKIKQKRMPGFIAIAEEEQRKKAEQEMKRAERKAKEEEKKRRKEAAKARATAKRAETLALKKTGNTSMK